MIGVETVACNRVVVALITDVFNAAPLPGIAVLVFEASIVSEISVVSSLGKDVSGIEDFRIVDGSNVVVTSSLAVLVMVLEFNAAVVDGGTLVVKFDVIADSVVAENFKAVSGAAVAIGLVAVGSGAVVTSAAILVTLVVIADNEDIEGVLEVVWITVTINEVIPVDFTKRVKFSDEVSVVVRRDLLATGITFVVKVGFMVRWEAAVSTTADVVTDIAVVAGNSLVGEAIIVFGNTAVLLGGADEVFETSTLIEVFVVLSLENVILVTGDAEIVSASDIVVTSVFAVVIMVSKFVAVIAVIEGDMAVDFPVGERFKAVEEVIGVRMGLLAIANNEDVKRVLELVDFIIESNVVIPLNITEGVECTEDVVRLDLITVGTDSVLMFEFIIC